MLINGFTSVTSVHEKTWNESLVLQIWSRKRVKEQNKTLSIPILIL